MTSNDLFITYILDRSGSMRSIWTDVLGGLNTYLDEQRKAEDKTWLSLVTFDSVVETPFVAWNVNDIPTVTDDHVSPRGATALFDAIGTGIANADKWHTENPWFDGKTLVAIMTDGFENSSIEQTKESIKKLIQSKEAAGWTIAYMGANQDAWDTAQGFGVSNKGATVTWQASPAGTQAVYRTMTRSTSNLRSGGTYQDDQNNAS